MLKNHAVRKKLFFSDAFPFEDTAGSAPHPQCNAMEPPQPDICHFVFDTCATPAVNNPAQDALGPRFPMKPP